MLDSRRRQLFQLLLYQSYARIYSELISTRAGFLWWFIEPILQMLVYYLVFSVLLDQGTKDYVPFLLIGLSVWLWFNSCVAEAASSILQNRALLQQVAVSKILFPSVALIVNSCKFAMTFLVLLIFLWITGLLPNKAYLALPLLMATQFLFIAGCSYLCAALVPFLPDLRILIGHGLRALMFFSGIFYSDDMIPASLREYFFLNPMASLIHGYREIIIEGAFTGWNYLIGISIASLFLILISKYIIARFDSVYTRMAL
jgi:lipopolysaccharide transport system permease protein